MQELGRTMADFFQAVMVVMLVMLMSAWEGQGWNFPHPIGLFGKA